MKCKLYTDGACSNNPGPGGWAFYAELEDNTAKTESGFEASTTNNRMELIATIKAITYAYEKKFSKIDLYTDSKYVMQGITLWCANWQKNNWRTANRQPVKNQDLWQELLSISKRVDNLNWFWVKGHAGNLGNEKADMAARNEVLKNAK